VVFTIPDKLKEVFKNQECANPNLYEASNALYQGETMVNTTDPHISIE
jgi:hypothetical protein